MYDVIQSIGRDESQVIGQGRIIIISGNGHAEIAEQVAAWLDSWTWVATAWNCDIACIDACEYGAPVG